MYLHSELSIIYYVKLEEKGSKYYENNAIY